MTKKEIVSFSVAGIIFAIVLAVVLLLNLINTAQAIQIIISFVLVLITTIYVKRTSDIAKATKEQAEASIRMAKQVEEQRYSESLPLLVPIINPIVSPFAQELEPNEVPYELLQGGISATWENLGKGVAINTRFSFWAASLDSHPGKALFFSPRESTVLEIGGRKEINYIGKWGGQLHDIPQGYYPRLEAEYQDIYERKVTTVQKFRIEEENGNKRAFLGDLYFTVNGERLGEELPK